MVLRDEADILPQTLDHLLSWLDGLWVLDTGSLDGSPDLLADRARQDQRLTFVGTQPLAFTHRNKAILFERIRSNFRKGDWICRADADERYLVHPPTFLAERVARRESVVAARMLDTVLLRRDLAAWESGREGIADRARPIDDRRTHFIANDFPEVRLFRYRPSMRWPATLMQPRFCGVMARARIAVRHDKWRDPLQAQWRSTLRQVMAPRMAVGGEHWTSQPWQSQVRRANEAMPWARWEQAPQPPRHIPPPAKHMAVRFAHASGAVRLVERLLPGTRADWALDTLPPEVEARLREAWHALHGPGALPTLPDSPTVPPTR